MSKIHDDQILKMLRSSGQKWSIREGKKHLILSVAGRPVTTLPRSRRNSNNLSAVANSRAAVRRALRRTEP